MVGLTFVLGIHSNSNSWYSTTSTLFERYSRTNLVRFQYQSGTPQILSCFQGGGLTHFSEHYLAEVRSPSGTVDGTNSVLLQC